MSKKTIVRIRMTLEIITQCLLFFSILFGVYFGIFKAPLSDTIKLLYIIPVTIAAYFARRYIKSSEAFILVHILFVVGAFFIGTGEREKFIITGIIVALCIVSMVFRSHKDEKGHEKIPAAYIFVFLIEYYSGYASQNGVVMEFTIWCAVLYVILYLLYINFTRLEDLFFINSGKANFPEKRITSTNVIIMCFSTFAVLIGMLLFYSGPFGNIFVILKNAFLKFLSWILKFFLKDTGEEIESEFEYTLPTEESESETESNAKPVEMPFKDFLNALLVIIGIVLVAVIVVLIVIAIKKALTNVVNMRSTDADEIENIDEDIDERAESPKKKRRDEINDTDLNLKTRKIYKKHVKSAQNTKGAPHNSDVPSDITQLFADGEDADMVTDIYEKARYSNETVTKDEVEIVKNKRREK